MQQHPEPDPQTDQVLRLGCPWSSLAPCYSHLQHRLRLQALGLSEHAEARGHGLQRLKEMDWCT
eukprot:3232915-Amphidinium_carterae.5